jgi:hypothetical protein
VRNETPDWLVRRHVPLVELDRHDAQYVFPVRLVLEDLAQLRLGGLTGHEEVQRLTGYLCAGPALALGVLESGKVNRQAG